MCVGRDRAAEVLVDGGSNVLEARLRRVVEAHAQRLGERVWQQIIHLHVTRSGS